MRTTLSQQKFLDSEVAANIRKSLERMLNDVTFNTASTYSSTMEERLSFIDTHMKYLSEHPKLDPEHYLSNLRLKTRVRS